MMMSNHYASTQILECKTILVWRYHTFYKQAVKGFQFIDEKSENVFNHWKTLFFMQKLKCLIIAFSYLLCHLVIYQFLCKKPYTYIKTNSLHEISSYYPWPILITWSVFTSIRQTTWRCFCEGKFIFTEYRHCIRHFHRYIV